MTPIDPGTWYFWPVTSMALAVMTAVHLYGRARSRDLGVSTALGLAGGSMLAVGLAFSALAASVDIGCSDIALVRFEPGLALVVAVLIACASLWALELAAGTSARQATLWLAMALIGAGVAGFLEFAFTWFELEHHCNELGDWRFGHLLAGVVVASCAGLVLGWRMQVRRRQAVI